MMRALPVLVFGLAVLLPAPPAAARGSDEPASRMPESVRRVEHETGGRVLHVRPIQRGDREVYRMKVLTPEGRVRVMQDDPPRARREPPPPRGPARERERDD